MQKTCSSGPNRTGIMKTRPFPLPGGADAKGFPTAVRKPGGGPEASRGIRDMPPKSRKRTCSSGYLRYLDPEEWQQIIERFPAGSRFHIPLMIGFYTGLRISDAFALTWDDIGLENRAPAVSKQVIKRNFGADVSRAVEKKKRKCFPHGTSPQRKQHLPYVQQSSGIPSVRH